jgi:hypothetical protein
LPPLFSLDDIRTETDAVMYLVINLVVEIWGVKLV